MLNGSNVATHEIPNESRPAGVDARSKVLFRSERALWHPARPLYIATGLSVWVTLLRLAGGTGPFEETGTPYARTIVLYYVGCVLGGFLLGALLPLRRWALGSMVLGIIVVLPIYSTFAFTRSLHSDSESPWRIPGVLMVSVLAGGILGLYAWSHGRQR